jgi:hypothetical protein
MGGGGFLDASYGVADERRSKLIKRGILWGGLAVLVAVILFFWLRNWRQEQTIKQFFSLLEQKRYQDAYAMWGCTAEHPCKYYSPEKFLEDWGSSSPYAHPSAIKIAHEDNCGNGVVFDIEAPKVDPQGLFVDKSTNTLSFAPEARCPGRHLQLWEFLKSRFS